MRRASPLAFVLLAMVLGGCDPNGPGLIDIRIVSPKEPPPQVYLGRPLPAANSLGGWNQWSVIPGPDGAYLPALPWGGGFLTPSRRNPGEYDYFGPGQGNDRCPDGWRRSRSAFGALLCRPP